MPVESSQKNINPTQTQYWNAHILQHSVLQLVTIKYTRKQHADFTAQQNVILHTRQHDHFIATNIYRNNGNRCIFIHKMWYYCL